MSYLVLARKWRPQSFEELVGQEQVSRTLANAIRSNRVAHAFLFTGVRGVGKTTAARILAKALNCLQGPTPTPCNECVNCREITAGSAVDVLEIDGASNTGVDDVREIIENVRYQPAKSRFKIYIIDEVHMLSTSAFNALLKTLEEPPAHVKFIFATTDPHKVPHTIHSRCQRYDFKRIPFRLIVERLRHIADSDAIRIGDRALFVIAREGEGSMRDAQSLLDQVIAFAGSTISDDDVGAALGLADRRLLYAAADAVLDHDAARAVEVLEALHQYGYDMRRFARELLEHFRNLAVARLVPGMQLVADVPDEDHAEIRRQAEKIGAEDADRAFRLLLATETEVARASSPKLVMEMALLRLATMAPVLPAEALLRRLDSLESRFPAAGAAAAVGKPPAGAAAAAPVAMPAPTSPAPGSDAAAAPPASSPAVPLGETWDEFLAYVAKEKVTVLAYVQASEPPALGGDALVLRVPKGYYYDYLVQRDHLQTVETLAQRFFARPLRVAVEVQAEQQAAEEASVDAGELHASAVGHPKVKAALEILGGQVQEVKSRARRGKGAT